MKPLAASEVVFFHPNTGSKLHFKANGDIQIVGAGLVTIDASSIEIAEGATLKLMNEAAVSLLNGHTHSGGPTMDQTLIADTHTTTKLKGA